MYFVTFHLNGLRGRRLSFVDDPFDLSGSLCLTYDTWYFLTMHQTTIPNMSANRKYVIPNNTLALVELCRDFESFEFQDRQHFLRRNRNYS
ncbi:hypothetical protein DPMN_118376 [Dreissena polymorpha]|uniref:Uncharacterized protein n=1 Tax=Dreissena polymorpha TaxID=45954 RepID=A0A9D4GK06_DREPO|nr:hypothetical protein DPMN_118376 [Dreissena polymorpha]